MGRTVNDILRHCDIGGEFEGEGRALDLASDVYFESTLSRTIGESINHLIFTLYSEVYKSYITFGITHAKPCDSSGVQIKLTNPGLIRGGITDRRYASDVFYIFPTINPSPIITKKSVGTISNSVIESILDAIEENQIFYPTVKEHIPGDRLFIYRKCYLTGTKYGIKVDKSVWYGFRELGDEGKRKARKEYFDTHASFR